MKQGFMSIDGKFFISEAKCKEHEATIGFVMYNADGTTASPYQALAVTILSEDGYKKFSCLCEKLDCDYRGLDGIGDWMWDNDMCRYIRLGHGSFKTLVRMYHDKYGNTEA